MSKGGKKRMKTDLVKFGNYVKAIRAGSDWLESKLEEDGSYGRGARDMAYYYKSPWAFAVSGKPCLASLIGDFVKEEFLKEDGDLLITKEERPFYDEWLQQHYLYFHGWLIYGLQKVGRFDITYKAAKFMLEFQDGGYGGFYSNKEKEYMDTLITSISGLCCLSLGRLNEAVEAGGFLASVLREQDDEDRFYTSLSRSGNLVKEFREDRKRYYVVEKGELNQWYFYLGLPIAFLAKLFEASNDLRYMESARRYFKIAEGCREDVFTKFGTGKLSWGSSLLHKHLRDEKYYDAAINIISDLNKMQTKEGAYLTIRSDYKSLYDQPLATSIDMTAETIAFTSETMQALY